MKIGFIGLGLMGIPMANNVSKQFPLYVYNRTHAKVAEVKNATWIDSAAKLADTVDILIIMVSDDKAATDIVDAILHSKQNHAIIVNMSTITKHTSIKLGNKANNAGFKYLEAPVAGSTGPATNATLKILVGGDKEVFEKIQHVLTTMGDQIFYTGPLGTAASYKLLINANLAVQMGILAETLAIGKELGLDSELLLETFNASAVKTVASQFKGPKVLKGDYTVAFPYEHMYKDLSYAEQLSTQANIISNTRNVYEKGLERHRRDDFSAIYKHYLDSQ